VSLWRQRREHLPRGSEGGEWRAASAATQRHVSVSVAVTQRCRVAEEEKVEESATEGTRAEVSPSWLAFRVRPLGLPCDGANMPNMSLYMPLYLAC
jgi:hypothetical protein